MKSDGSITDWKYCWATIEVTQDDVVLQWRPETGIDGKKLSVCGFKLEKGNKPTDWTPAPEDAEAEFENYETRISTIEQTADGLTISLQTVSDRSRLALNNINDVNNNLSSLINTQGGNIQKALNTANDAYNTANTANTKAGTAQSTANTANTNAANAQTDIDNLAIGGRNLIAGTSLTQEYSGNKGSASYKDVWTGATLIIPTGTEYIVSFEARADVAQTIICYFYSPNTTTSSKSSTGQGTTSSDGSCNVTLTTEWKRYWVKWTQTPATAKKAVIVGRNTTVNNIYIRAVKLEEGNRATGWTPAPEDVDSDIATAQSTADTAKANAATAQSTANTARTEAAAAAKTATNFLSYDSTNGLLIGNKSSGSWSGSRAQITSSAFNILDSSGVQLASYGSTTTIGKTASGNKNVLIESTGIKLRNGTTVLAMFTPEVLYLGYNSYSTKIDLLNGVGSIYATGDSGDSSTIFNRLFLQAPNVYLKGESASLDTSTQYGDSTQSFSASAYANVTAQSYQGSSSNWAAGAMRAVHQATGNEAQIKAAAYSANADTGVWLYASGSAGNSQVYVLPNYIDLITPYVHLGNSLGSYSAQSAIPYLKWKTWSSKTPYIGYASDQSDGTFVVASITGTNYASGLAIGGGSGNLLYKGKVVLDASNYSAYAAPQSHKSTGTGYGVGDASYYGHLKLSDSTSSTSSTSGGIAATPAAVKAAYDKANHSHPYAATSHEHPYAAASHVHNYLPLAGGTIAGTSGDTPLYVRSASTGSYIGLQNSGGNSVHNTLSLIGTKGQETLQMAACLNTVQQIAQGLNSGELKKEQRKENTVAVINTLSLITTRGQETLYMAACVNTLQKVIQELNAPEEEPEEAEEETEEETEPVPQPKKKKK